MTTTPPSAEALYEYDKVEWFDVCRQFNPTLTWKKYSEQWEEFQRLKAERTHKGQLQ